MSRLLVTGGTGLCGREIIQELTGDGHTVVATTRQGPLSDDDGQIRWVVCDLASVDQARLDELFGTVEAIVHFAAYVPLREQDAQFEPCFAVNVEGTLRLLQWAVRRNVKRFVYASSCSVYGPAESSPVPVIDEEHPVNPASYYAVTKLCAERLVRTCAWQDGLKATVFRIGYVYGAGLSRTRLVHKILNAVAHQDTFSMTNADKSVMHLVHVRDVARAVGRAIDGPEGVFNLVHESQPTLRMFWAAAEEALGRRCVLLDHETKERCDPRVAVKRLKDQFQWAPEMPLVEGLRGLSCVAY